MKIRSIASARFPAVALSAVLLVVLTGVAADPAVAGNKKSHHSATHTSVTGSSQAADLKTLQKEIKGEKKAIFQAVFEYGGGTKTIPTRYATYAQDPPKYYIKETTNTIIHTGTESFTCNPTTTNLPSAGSTSGSTTNPTGLAATGSTGLAATTTTTAQQSKDVCDKSTGSGSATGTAALLFDDILNPTNIVEYFKENAASEKLAGYSVKFFNKTYGGIPSQCVTVKSVGISEQDCIGNNGLLTYGGSSRGFYELKSFSKSVPSSDFTVPADARIVTQPGA